MAQTGDPTGTGRGGSSIYGKFFNDEIHADLKHTGLLFNELVVNRSDPNQIHMF
jgi:cyclophilin family peptidyl-prolyl cis-trans isomerase